MSDTYIPSFFSDDPRTGALTYAQLETRRRIAAALATRNRAYPKTIGEGLTALGEGLGEGYMMRGLERSEAAQAARDTAAGKVLLGGDAPAAAPTTLPGSVSAAPAIDPNIMAMATPEDVQSAAAQTEKFPVLPEGVRPKMPVPEFKQRIARTEPIDRANPYKTVGEQNRRGDFPYGKYAIMGENIPKWSKEYIGKELTPQQFLDDEKAQEEIASARSAYYLNKYGENGAAAAWFAGEHGMNDKSRMNTLGRHVDEYVRRFNIPLVSRDDVVASAAAAPTRLASLGGAPTPDTAPDPARAAVAQQIAGPPPPPPQQTVPPQLVAQAPQQQTPIGVQPTPAGPEPQLRTFIEGNPALKQQMDAARQIALDPRYSPTIQAQAQERYKELERRANDAFTKQWTIWHERTKGEEAFRLGAEERERTRQTHQQKVPQQPAPAPPSPMAGNDPRLGTPESPQRNRVPMMPSVPPGVSPEAWSKEQAPLLAKSLEAVEKATPMFDDALKVIQLARTHPGREWGIGATGDIAQKLPWTDAAGFGKVVEQLKGKNFLAGYQHLKGAGPVSEIEGLKTEAAQARVSTAQNKRDFDAALNDLELSMRRDLETMQRKTNQPVTAWRAPGDNASFAPDIGERRGNNEYIGGNPSDPASWRRVQ